MKLQFLNANGTLKRDILKQITSYMHRTKGKLVTVEYKVQLPTRSLVQNAYYWGVVLYHLSLETGYKTEQLHILMKEMFGQKIEIFGTMVVKSTTEYTTIEFEDFLADIRAWAGDFLSMYIPLPNETNLNYYNIPE